jgi:hypothetical protein
LEAIVTDDVEQLSGTSAKVAGRLVNFATGQADLLPGHIDFLEKEVAAVLRGMQGPWVDLIGYASRRGDAVFNQTLSERRVDAVKRRISQLAQSVNFQIKKGVGETQSGQNERDNSGRYRAVDVYVYAYKPPPPEPTPTTEERIIYKKTIERVVTEKARKGQPEPSGAAGLWLDEFLRKLIAGNLEAKKGVEKSKTLRPVIAGLLMTKIDMTVLVQRINHDGMWEEFDVTREYNVEYGAAIPGMRVRVHRTDRKEIEKYGEISSPTKSHFWMDQPSSYKDLK